MVCYTGGLYGCTAALLLDRTSNLAIFFNCLAWVFDGLLPQQPQEQQQMLHAMIMQTIGKDKMRMTTVIHMVKNPSSSSSSSSLGFLFWRWWWFSWSLMLFLCSCWWWSSLCWSAFLYWFILDFDSWASLTGLFSWESSDACPADYGKWLCVWLVFTTV